MGANPTEVAFFLCVIGNFAGISGDIKSPARQDLFVKKKIFDCIFAVCKDFVTELCNRFHNFPLVI